MNYCKCGCGETVKKKYKRGHGSRDRKLSEIHKNRISISIKKNLPSSVFKKEQHPSPKTEFKKGQRPSKNTEFKKGHRPWNKNLTKNDSLSVLKISKSKLGDKNPAKRIEVKEKMRESKLKNIQKNFNNNLPLSPTIGKHETQIIDYVEKQLDIKFKRQYYCGGYFLDGYNEEHKLAIEVDEPFHEKQKEKDLERQIYIENKLGCNFIRIKDSYIKIMRGKNGSN